MQSSCVPLLFCGCLDLMVLSSFCLKEATAKELAALLSTVALPTQSRCAVRVHIRYGEHFCA